ncbi:HipA domain-containing protein [Vreelandella arcis]|uniref:HipA domain-containing protein n=1 Tax=Vreelandella arcis TaxID=416873 RepID=UPI001FCDB7B6|nr:HipA domain-containing protein [Halomonas arcis]
MAGHGSCFVIERFDRLSDGSAVHIEDFTQVFDVYAEQKYKTATLRNIAQVLAAETSDADIAEFIRRLVFCVLTGNGDMHMKNWSLIYPDRRNACSGYGSRGCRTLPPALAGRETQSPDDKASS